jgi:hypothetical protein
MWRAGPICVVSFLIIHAGQAAERLSVNDPRPLSAAVDLVERRCHCAITYEDPLWRSDDVALSGPHWPAMIPKGGLFTFDAPDLAATTPAQMAAAMAQVVRVFEQSGSGRGAFRVTNDATTVHVVPRPDSILDTPVTIAHASRRLNDAVTVVLAEVERATGQRVELAAFPTNFFFQHRVEVEAKQESAREVLVRALAESGRALSWRVFFDARMRQYYFNILFVP